MKDEINDDSWHNYCISKVSYLYDNKRGAREYGRLTHEMRVLREKIIKMGGMFTTLASDDVPNHYYVKLSDLYSVVFSMDIARDVVKCEAIVHRFIRTHEQLVSKE